VQSRERRVPTDRRPVLAGKPDHTNSQNKDIAVADADGVASHRASEPVNPTQPSVQLVPTHENAAHQPSLMNAREGCRAVAPERAKADDPAPATLASSFGSASQHATCRARGPQGRPDISTTTVTIHGDGLDRRVRTPHLADVVKKSSTFCSDRTSRRSACRPPLAGCLPRSDACRDTTGSSTS
jgi:hypothetical protein